MKIRSIAVLALLALVVVACRPRTEPAPKLVTSTPSPQPTPGESPISPPGTPTPPQPEEGESPLPEPGTSPASTPSTSVAGVKKAAREHLAAELDLAPEQVEAFAVEPVDWSDASLGCPEPGKAYAQIITPGYRILLRAAGKEYEVHTDTTGKNVVICERTLKRGPTKAVEYLAEELGTSAEQIEVLSVEMYEWPDASLGCPEPGKAYAQVITPGYRVILEAAGRKYELHTDETGRNVVICEPNQ